MELELELKNLNEEYQSLSLKLDAINKRRNEIKRELLLKKYFDKYEISIGDDVIFNGERVKVDSADANYLYIRKYKKDGSLYSSVTRTWSFDRLLKLK
jgi:ASC-1-like (ASCH) protein